MVNIRLVNENGTIVGKDTDTGETVPVSIESIHTDQTTTAELDGAFIGETQPANGLWVDTGDPEVVPGKIVNASHESFSSVQDALDYADADDIPEIYIPAGTYSGQIHPYPSQTITGAGPTRTTLTHNDTLQGTTNNPEYSRIRNLSAETTAASVGVFIGYGNMIYENVHILGAVAGSGSDEGLGFNPRSQTPRHSVTVRGCSTTNCDGVDVMIGNVECLITESRIEGEIRFGGTSADSMATGNIVGSEGDYGTNNVHNNVIRGGGA